ncbi:MAG: SRPBCC family protein [Actinomycetota bacterium]
MSLEVTKRFELDADADELFTKLTSEFTEVSSWASGIRRSEPNPKYGPVADGVAGGRICQVDGFGSIDEQLVQYEPALRRFAYTAEAEKIPGFVKDLRNQWTIEAAPNGRSVVQLRLTAEVTGPLGAVMKPMMRRRFDRTLDIIGDDLRAYAERDTISDRKAAELGASR